MTYPLQPKLQERRPARLVQRSWLALGLSKRSGCRTFAVSPKTLVEPAPLDRRRFIMDNYDDERSRPSSRNPPEWHTTLLSGRATALRCAVSRSPSAGSLPE